jgi:DNA-binding transcriptional LysR family regulator
MGTVDLDLLALFVAVAQTESFSGAARRLGVPKSSVSRGIAALEKSLGLTLLHRTTRRVSLSTAGTALLERVAPLLGELERSVIDLPDLEAQPSGKLRITAPVDFGATVLADVVARFVCRFPAVEVDLAITNQTIDLIADGFDMAVRIASRPLGDSALVARRLGTLSVQLFAAPSYLARRGTPRSPRDLDAHDWVIFRGLRSVKLDGPGGVVTVTPHGRVSVDDAFFTREAVRSGAGIAALPTFLAEADVASGQLTRVVPRWTARSGALWLLWPGSRHLPRKAAAFRDFLVESLAARPLGVG